jgi:hypothetical protein
MSKRRKRKKAVAPCAACGEPSFGRHSIHRDGFGLGPEVWLCDGCGASPLPTLYDLWKIIKHRRLEGFPMEENRG